MKYYDALTEKTSRYTMEGVLDYFNKRIRIDQCTGSLTEVVRRVEELACKHQLSKLIIKGALEHTASFMEKGYVLEAIVPHYFRGNTAGFFTRYRDATRRNSVFWVQEDDLLQTVFSQQPTAPQSVPASFVLRQAKEEDAPALAKLFSDVFQVYPTPLNKADYVKRTMQEDTIYYVYVADGSIISAASAEIDSAQENAELTNCATLPAFRRHGLMKCLLQELEDELCRRRIFCAYTIARALSYGMNAAFYQLGYTYYGRLANNCYIFDKIEDMNVWAKDLAP